MLLTTVPTVTQILSSTVDKFVRDENNSRGKENLVNEDLKESIKSQGVLIPLVVFPESFNTPDGKMVITEGNCRHYSVEELINQGELPSDYQIPYYILDESIASDKKKIRLYRLSLGTTNKHLTPTEQASDVKGWIDDYTSSWLADNQEEFDNLPPDKQKIKLKKVAVEAKKELMKISNKSQQWIDNILSFAGILETSEIASFLVNKNLISVDSVADARRSAEAYQMSVDKVLHLAEKVRKEEGLGRISKVVMEKVEDVLELHDDILNLVEDDCIPISLAATLKDNDDALEIVARALAATPDNKVTTFSLSVAEDQIKAEKGGNGFEIPPEEVVNTPSTNKTSTKKVDKPEKVVAKLSEEDRTDAKSKIETSNLALSGLIDSNYKIKGSKGKLKNIPDEKLLEIAKLAHKLDSLIAHLDE